MVKTLNSREPFYKTVLKIAVPVTLQSLLQASFSVVDQMMIGRLGSSSIAGVGLGGKFSSLYTVLLGAVAAVAGIMISQYIGQKDAGEVGRSFRLNLKLALGLAMLAVFVSMCFPGQIMWLYTKDEVTRGIAAEYLRILALAFVPMAIVSILSTLLRCMEAAMFPLYASMASAVLNTALNYLLIFGKIGLPQLGVRGAAAATVISQWTACLITIGFGIHFCRKNEIRLKTEGRMTREYAEMFLKILCPIIICEFLWSLGENVYAAIYGNIGTAACAAMTLTIPIQTLMMGALSGLSQAAAILIGKALGAGEYDRAYWEAKRLMIYGLCGSLAFSTAICIVSRFYVQIYHVEAEVHKTAVQLLIVYALIAPVKVQNMLLGGGIIRSGGKTNYVMWIDFIGTWIFGVPLGLLSAFVWKLEIPYVYFILSLEECVRFGMSLVVFRKKKWMRSLNSL